MTKDEEFLLEAVSLARRGEGRTRPNPPVGAVVVRDGRIVGRGWHKKAGGDHAEVAALKSAGSAAKGSTVYVTLEPCSTKGRVGACTDALAAAEVGRVVYGAVDPNPKNRGKARRVLAGRGIVCERVRSAECEELIAPFAKFITTGIPYVTVKIAMSLDGRICDDFGDARWISSAKSRKTTLALRAAADAVMVGAETVRKDNPSLLSRPKRNDGLIRAVVSRSGKLPPSAQVFTDGAPNPTLVFRDASEALRELAKRGVIHVLCEGGLELARSLSAQGLVDRWITVLAPKVIGHAHIADAAVLDGPDAILTFTNHHTGL